MNKNSKILLIVEGQKAEPTLFKSLFSNYNIQVTEKNIYSYDTNIFTLYNKVFKEYEDDLDDMDFLLSLAAAESDPNKKKCLTSVDYSDIILVFDYEPQDPKFNMEHLMIMMKYFDESTDHGKLYINYPCVESVRHFKSIPDKAFINRKVPLIDITEFGYKRIVGDEACIQDLRKIDKNLFDYLIKENVNKGNMILNNQETSNFVKKYRALNFLKLLDKIDDKVSKEGDVYILNTSIFFICDYDINLISQD